MSSTDRITVCIVDDHEIVRRGLRVSIETFADLHLLADAQNAEEAVTICKEHQPDVLLLDLVLPEVGGVEIIPRVQEVSPRTNIIALTNFKDRRTVQAAVEAGATGYILKNVGIDELAQAIRTASQGKSILAPEAAQILIEATYRKPEPGGNLTPREIEVLKLMATGLTNGEIGERLYISRSTVKNHVSNILMKLDVATRTEAVTVALKYQIIPSD